MIYQFEVAADCTDSRIDSYLNEQIESFSRSYIQHLIKDGAVWVNGKTVKPNYKCKYMDSIQVCAEEKKELEVIAQDIPLSILYEDDDIIIVNKPKNMVVHPAAGHESGTLVNALLFHCKGRLSTINGVIRPGIVHRIDRNTTGLLVICKNDSSHHFLAEQLKEHSITRKYHAICHGTFKEQTGTIDAPIGRHETDRKKMAINRKNGRRAVTHYRVIKNLGTQYSYIECTLETGRTHQIRVHMASIGHPILGDDVYGPKNSSFKHLEGQTLHAKVLGFLHPGTKKYIEFDSDLPEYFQDLIKKLDA